MNQHLPPPPAPPSTLQVISRFLDLVGASGGTADGVKLAALEIERHGEEVARHELRVAQLNDRVAELNLDAREAAVSKREADMERREQAVAETEARHAKFQQKIDRWDAWYARGKRDFPEYFKG